MVFSLDLVTVILKGGCSDIDASMHPGRAEPPTPTLQASAFRRDSCSLSALQGVFGEKACPCLDFKCSIFSCRYFGLWYSYLTRS